MIDVFLSYSRDDQATARRFAEAFQREGLSVWWDQTLKPGEAFDEVTEKALNEAKAVVVLWSKASVGSRWVRAEATQAHDNKTLMPVMIEACKRPIMFELTHTADLSKWKGDGSNPAWQTFLTDVRHIVLKGAPVTSSGVVQPANRVPGKSGARILLVLVALLVIGAAAFWIASRSARVDSKAAEPAIDPATVAKAVTLAVLPFADYSTAHDQESFCDGLSEEILNQVAQVKGLAVTARTSSFSFKGKNEDMREIAKALGVANLLEGSIQKEGNQLRITAQLIDGNAGTHLWSKTYAREHKDIFAVQEEIAKDVAHALSIKLDVGSLPRTQGGTTNIEAYDAYLAGLALSGQKPTPETLRQMIDHFQQAVALDSTFAAAWLNLSDAYRAYAVYTGQESPAEATTALEQVKRLSPDSPLYYMALVDRSIESFTWKDATHQIQSARARAAGNTLITSRVDVWDSFVLMLVGRFKDAVAPARRASRGSPLEPQMAVLLSYAYFGAGEVGEDSAELERGMKLPGGQVLRLTVFEHAVSSRNRVQMDKWIDSAIELDNSALHVIAAMKPLLDRPVEALAKLHRLAPAATTVVDVGEIAIWAAYFGDSQFAFDLLPRMESFRIGRGRALPLLLWNPLLSDVRKMPGFKKIVRDMGMVEYWREYGWADLCKPVGKDDFECH
jgi:TolB-like protein